MRGAAVESGRSSSELCKKPNFKAALPIASLLALFVALVLTMFHARLDAATPPEYIAAELPSGATLEEARSATSAIGVVPEKRALPYSYLPSKIFPLLRKQIGKTGIPFFDDAVL